MRPLYLSLALIACSSTVLPTEDDGGGGSTLDDVDGTGNNNNQGASSSGGSPIDGGHSAQGGGAQGGKAQGGSSNNSNPNSMDTMDSMDVEPVGGSSSTGMPLCDAFPGQCSQCVANECGQTWCSCTENQECITLLGCFGNCMTEECYQECMAAHPDGAADAFNVLACPSCTDLCGGAQPADPCTQCLYTDCEEELNACVGEPDCVPLWNCLIECPQGGLTCQNNCYDAFPDGIQTLETMFNCTSNECVGECQ